MFAHVKFESALVGLVCIAVVCMNGRASAVTAEVARKGAALTAKAYPPRVSGNPAAGLAKGTAQSKRDYFNKCVANGGNVDDDADVATTMCGGRALESTGPSGAPSKSMNSARTRTMSVPLRPRPLV